MHDDELSKRVFAAIEENDQHRASKKLHLSWWIFAFRGLFESAGENDLPFFLDILTDNDCWEKTDTIHRIRLNRRLVAKKIVQLRSPMGCKNPLEDIDRFQVACWCCLEEEIIVLFNRLKRKFRIKMSYLATTRKLVTALSTATWSDPMMRYWLYKMGGYHTGLKFDNKNLLLYGQTLASYMKVSGKAHFVEAVEYFWSKIKTLPEDELNTEKKQEILMKTALFAASHSQLETLEFCFSELSPDKYAEFLKRDFAKGKFFHCSLAVLHDMFRVDLLKKCFDTFQPNDISTKTYQLWAESFHIIKQYPDPYEREAVKVFMHIWTKKGFDDHRAFMLRKLCSLRVDEDHFLVGFTKKNYMEPVWAVLDKASRFEIAKFMDCVYAESIEEILEEKGDLDSLNKFLSYNPGPSDLETQ